MVINLNMIIFFGELVIRMIGFLLLIPIIIIDLCPEKEELDESKRYKQQLDDDDYIIIK